MLLATGATSDLSQGGQSLAEGGPLAKTQQKVGLWPLAQLVI